MPQALEYNPLDRPDAVAELTLLIRTMRMGDRVTLPNGTVVRSVGIKHGAHMDRRFAVVPKGTAIQRHRALTLGRGAVPSAEEAARKALDKPKGE